MIDLDEVMKTALSAIERAGIPCELVLLAITDQEAKDEEGTPFEIHVGATENRSTAGLLTMLAQDLKSESEHQSRALSGKEDCPVCASPRYGGRQRVDEDMRLHHWDECMACGYRRGDE